MKKKSLELFYHSMMLPGTILLIIFSVIPMFGLVMAFQKFDPFKGILGSPFVGLHQFKLILLFPDAQQVFVNTVIIAISKIVLNLLVPISFALLLNECRTRGLKRTIQTIVYLPHFLSWVIVAIMFSSILSYTGLVNGFLKLLGRDEPIMFMASNTWFRPVIVFTEVWKSFGFGAVVYIAAITAIDNSLYEAGEIDGANRWQKIKHITLPCIMPTILIMATLSLGNVLNAGFDQVFNMYSPIVYQTGDILDTYVYRVGLERMQYSLGTAVGLFKSVISFFLIILSYAMAYKFTGYKIF